MRYGQWGSAWKTRVKGPVSVTTGKLGDGLPMIYCPFTAACGPQQVHTVAALVLFLRNPSLEQKTPSWARSVECTFIKLERWSCPCTWFKQHNIKHLYFSVWTMWTREKLPPLQEVECQFITGSASNTEASSTSSQCDSISVIDLPSGFINRNF